VVFFEASSHHIAQVDPRLTPDSWSSCLSLSSPGITGVQHAWLIILIFDKTLITKYAFWCCLFKQQTCLFLYNSSSGWVNLWVLKVKMKSLYNHDIRTQGQLFHCLLCWCDWTITSLNTLHVWNIFVQNRLQAKMRRYKEGQYIIVNGKSTKKI
jgi:hypothetical protein